VSVGETICGCGCCDVKLSEMRFCGEVLGVSNMKMLSSVQFIFTNNHQ
jgi:hypothetical protein